jgi:hypothetical protein
MTAPAPSATQQKQSRLLSAQSSYLARSRSTTAIGVAGGTVTRRCRGPSTSGAFELALCARGQIVEDSGSERSPLLGRLRGDFVAFESGAGRGDHLTAPVADGRAFSARSVAASGRPFRR